MFQFSSVAQSCLTLCNPMDCSTPGFLVHHHSRSLLKLMSIESVMPFNHLILCCPFLLLPSLFLSIRLFSKESVLHTRWPKYWSFSFSIVLPMNIQGWLPLGLTGLIFLQSKGLSRVFSSITVQKNQFCGAQPSLWSNSYGKTIVLTIRTFVGKLTFLLFNMLSMFVTVFIPRSKHLLKAI